ncbi:hypothetical protein [Paenibacillus donghaensis]|uniref:Uncharacterized protein n=1 Tax=Paenibacillus donghaensis TaxID=414771 RepID=A0A2Z2KGL9_9BACL|nr:hypothetical protein [Paenibacillus donghaensis]ASA22310.1 hypothetical protein B9T62_16865 [Paenibacillus donghaensis]
MNPLEVAKEIVVSALENGIIKLPEADCDTHEQLSELNAKRAKEIGNYFKVITKAVHEANNKNFSFE